MATARSAEGESVNERETGREWQRERDEEKETKREGGLNLKKCFISLWKQKKKKETRRRKEKEEYS